MSKLIAICILFLVVLTGSFKESLSHGRFLDPPSRSSVWRNPRFASFNPPINYNDMELFCGGIHQEMNPGLSCGVCGDRLSEPVPRMNEIGGKYYSGIITGRYKSGKVIKVQAEITASHKGFMEWRICDDVSSESQECFDKHLLKRADRKGTRVFVDDTGFYSAKLRLPKGLICNHCVMQWNYRAGNNWGNCGNGSSAVGCGPQETFRGCADISVD